MSERRVVLVTGASLGIGRDLARTAAQDGCDVILVARSKDKLETLAAELEKAHGGRAHVIDEDLGDREAPARIEARVKALGAHVDDLVNNAGFGSNGAFMELPLERELEMVQVNISALVALCHRFGGAMRARGRGRILNIASTAAFQGGPFMATYYATKAFVLSFSEALAVELAGTGVTVTCFCPGPVATEFARTAGNDESKLFKQGGAASADEVARAAWAAMKARKVIAIHGPKNWIGAVSTRFVPRSWPRGIAGSLNRKP